MIALPEPVRTNLFIGGETVGTSDYFSIFDPAMPSRDAGQAAAASEVEIASAIDSATAAFGPWAALTANERAEILKNAVDGIEAFRDQDAALLSAEIGKTLHESWVDALVFELRWNLALNYAHLVDEVSVLAPLPQMPTRTAVSRQALGVVTIIIPFNWPLAILAASLPQALLAGNTVIVKPPVSAPLATTVFLTRIAKKLPAGVLNVVTGLDENLSELISSPKIAKVCFTGSVAGGKKMMQLASGSLTRLTLELGGNDPAILLADALLDDEHLDRLFSSIFDTSGQICMNVKRVYVHISRLDELVAGLSTRLEKVVLGHGLSHETTHGPLHSITQKTYVDSLIAEARESGATVLEFGSLPSDPELAQGHFVRPALVIDPNPTLRVVTEEQFGPVIGIIPFESVDLAIVQANDSWAGLGASVWSNDLSQAQELAKRLVAGYIWINDHGAPRLDLRAPFGGMKQSGFGREQGIEGILDFTDTRAISIFEG
ncbi:MAG: hypothetical protein RL556_679 [Actinomycetota bacterium]